MIDAIVDRLAALEAMDYAALRAEWRRLYRRLPPKRVSRDLLRLGAAWKIQAQAYGDLDAATRRRLAALAEVIRNGGTVASAPSSRLKPGARLVREWGGETHTVVVRENGFEWRGARWRSLSAIAREITGVHWSGPRFFGLKGRTTSTGVDDA